MKKKKSPNTESFQERLGAAKKETIEASKEAREIDKQVIEGTGGRTEGKDDRRGEKKGKRSKRNRQEKGKRQQK